MIFLYQTIYRFFWYLLTPYLFYYLHKRAKKNSAYWDHKKERFGIFNLNRNCNNNKTNENFVNYWIHAVSLGEVRAATSLIVALCEQKKSIVLTNMTPTGRQESLKLQKQYPDLIEVVYLPYEHYVHKMIDVFNPQCLLVMETECWPRMLYVARHIPRYLVNARLSEKSQKSYQKINKIAGWMFAQFDKIMVQSVEDQKRILSFFEQKSVDLEQFPIIGNLKFDFPLNEVQIKQGEKLKAKWKESININNNLNTSVHDKKVIALISTRTHEGIDEEQLILTQLKKHFDDYLWLIVPRHPERFEHVATIIRDTFQKKIVQKSQLMNESNSLNTSFMLGDSLGEMAMYLAMSDIVIMGGSFLPLGSQNVIEPCLQGIPVIVGPSSFNFSESVRLGVETNAMLQISLEQLPNTVEMLQNEEEYVTIKNATKIYAHHYQGATQRVLDLLML